MTMKFYQIDLEQGGVTRTVRVPSGTMVGDHRFELWTR